MVRTTLIHTWLVATLVVGATFLTAHQAVAKTELLVFSSPYCGPCQQLKPTLAEFERDGFPVRHIDVTQHPALASQFRVSRVPCLVMVTDGRELNRQLGGDKSSIQRMYSAAGVQPGRADREVVPQWTQDTPAAPSLPTKLVSRSEPARPNPADHAPTVADGLDRQLLESSVRITVNDATGKSYGTGTIIDTLDNDALVVTCGHLFRGESEKGEIVIEQFAITPAGLTVVERTRGELVSHDLDRDVGLVSFRPTGKVKVAQVASQFGERVNDRVWSVGCDRGADPTVRDSRVTAIDRYHGPPNIETSGAPVQGRSGGGLFNSRGELIGICFAADNEGDEGLYSGLASVHAELDRIGMQAVYRGGAATRLASNPRAELMQLPAHPTVVRGQDPAAPQAMPSAFPAAPAASATVPSAGELPPVERAGLTEIARRASESEVVVIIRPREPNGESEVLTFDRVSPKFIEALRAMPR